MVYYSATEGILLTLIPLSPLRTTHLSFLKVLQPIRHAPKCSIITETDLCTGQIIDAENCIILRYSTSRGSIHIWVLILSA